MAVADLGGGGRIPRPRAVVPVVHSSSVFDVDVDVCGAVDVHIGVNLATLEVNVEVWVDAAAVLALSDVELTLEGPIEDPVLSSTVYIDVDVDVGSAFDVDVGGAIDGITDTGYKIR